MALGLFLGGNFSFIVVLGFKFDTFKLEMCYDE